MFTESELYWKRVAVRLIFFANGFAVATWAPLVPMIKINMSIADDVMGLLLLCVGIGSLGSMPLSGGLAQRFGCRKVITVSFLVNLLGLLALCFNADFWLLPILLLLLGASMGLVDVTMNIDAVIVEKMSRKNVMSGFHGMWSAGGFVGASVFSLWLTQGLSHWTSTCIACIIDLIIFAFCFKHLLDFGSMDDEAKGNSKKPLITIPRGMVAFMGIIICISYLSEGAIMDWSGILLAEVQGIDISLAALGFSSFSMSMLICRLTGDMIVSKLGERRVILGGGIIAIIGFAIVIAGFDFLISMLGFFLIGIGLANIVPVIYTQMGKQHDMPLSQAVAGASTMGYLGSLMGPAIMGFVASATNLYMSFCMLVVLLVIQFFTARYIFRKLE